MATNPASAYVLPVNYDYKCGSIGSLTATDRLHIQQAGNNGLYGTTLYEIFMVQTRIPTVDSTTTNAISRISPSYIVSADATGLLDQSIFIQQKTIYLGKDQTTAFTRGPVPVKLFKTTFFFKYTYSQTIAATSPFNLIFQVQVADPSTCDIDTQVRTDTNSPFFESATDFWTTNNVYPVTAGDLVTKKWITITDQATNNKFTVTSALATMATLPSDKVDLPFTGDWVQIVAACTSGNAQLTINTPGTIKVELYTTNLR